MRHARLAVTALLVAVAFGCGRASTVFDLARDVAIAETGGRFRTILFGTPPAEPQQALGFVRAERDGGDPRIWLQQVARIDVNLPADTRRSAVLDLELYPGTPGQGARVELNGAEVGRLELEAGRRRYSVDLPQEAQRKGLNELTVRFDRTPPRAQVLGRPVIAALYSLSLGRADDAALAGLVERRAPPPLATVERGSDLGLVQAGPSSIRYSFVAPPAAEVRTRVRLHAFSAESGHGARVSISSETEPGRTDVLWSGELRPRDGPAEIRVPLRAGPATPMRLALRADARGDGPVWVVWEAPRVAGGTPGEPEVVPAPFTAQEDRRADAVRGRLRDANVLLIVLDAARAQEFGCYGYSRNTTPEIDRMAREGVTFERAYTTGPYTRAGMGSIWTSQFPDDHGAVGPLSRLPAEPYPTLAEILTARGIHTAGFVANSVAGPAFGMARGFSEFVEVYKELGIEADAFRKVFPAWLRANSGRRFFAYAHFREPHFPYDPPPPFTTRFGPDGPIPAHWRRDRDWIYKAIAGTRPLSPAEHDHMVRLYDGSLAFADQEVGEMRRALESLGLLERTVVIVTADHGEALYEHGYIQHNQQLYEHSVRIPLVLRLPGGAGPAAARIEGLVDLLDLAPTIADVFAARDASGRLPASFRGRSLLPVTLGAPGKPFAFSRSLSDRPRPRYAIRDGRYTYIFDSGFAKEELYDRAEDPGEHRDLQAEEPLRAAVYRQRLWRWMSGLARREAESGEAALEGKPLENLKALGYVN